MKRFVPTIAACVLVGAQGCSTLPAARADKLAEARQIADKTTAHYGVASVRLFVRELPPTMAAGYVVHSNWIILRDSLFDSDAWVTVLAHELGHVVLRHDLPIVLEGGGRHFDAVEYARRLYQREFDANRKAVEIMYKILDIPERVAMRRVASYFVTANDARAGRAVLLPHGHVHPCDQFQRLVSGFPADWSADLVCKKQEGPYRGPMFTRDEDLKLRR